MTPIEKVIIENKCNYNPVWFMRQAGRYLPEFREIRSRNQDFIKLCLNLELVPEITLQPLKRFNIDAAIIFSDILMLPYGLGQHVTFKKDFGPILEDSRFVKEDISEDQFVKTLSPVYSSMNILSNLLKNRNKTLIGFVGAPWTILVYMLNKQSPKKILSKDLENKSKKDKLIKIIINFLKIHIKEQVKAGANLIQIFDSWAGIADDIDTKKYIYESTLELVEFTKSIDVPVICFPREIKNYSEYIKEIKPNAINIDYNVDIKYISEKVQIPVQGGLDPKFLLGDKDTLKKESIKILNNFKNHPYIFNLGHGVLPQTDPNMVDYLVKLVKDY